MDLTFIEGVAAVVAAIIVFCGSVWLLLTMVLGGRTAYFITASVTLAFLLIMGVIWSFASAGAPLGPVGELPEWTTLDIVPADEASEADFAAAADYPDGGGWRPTDPENDEQVTQASELGTSAAEFLDEAIGAGDINTFESADDATANTDTIRFLEQGDSLYGGVTLEATAGGQGDDTVAFMEYDFGNPLYPARVITIGTLILFVLHLLGLSWSERRARDARREPQPA